VRYEFFMRTSDQISVHLSEYSPFPFSIRHASLGFALSPDATIVTAKLLLDRRQIEGAEGSPLRLDGEGLELIELLLDGKTLLAHEYFIDETGLTIHEVPDSFQLETKASFSPAANTALSGLYMSGGRYCTQCEAEGFRRITFWPDRPDVMSRFHVRLEAPKADFPILLSNGNLVAFGDFDDGRHWAEWDDPHLKPSYLFALVAGDFDHIEDQFTTMNGQEVDLAIYVEKGQAERSRYAMDALKRSMVWDEDIFGREYDLDVFNIVAVSDFNGGAMENKGLNIFNSALIMADEQTATDSDYEAIESVVAHEYFHNWSGNRVTCRDWFQLSLKEGFTVFRDQEFSSDQRSRAVKRIKDVKALRARQFSEDGGPLAHPVRPASYVKIDNFYTSTVYEKGAEVIRVLQSLIGAQAFSAGVERYFDDNDGTAATIEDWLVAMRAASGNALIGIERWYDQAGTPNLKVICTHDVAAKTLTIDLSQFTPDTPGQTNKSWVPMPVRMAFFAPDGAPLRLSMAGSQIEADDWLIPMASDTLSLVFEGASQKPIPSILRGFSAPVRLETNLSDDDLALLASCDTDPFVRWESTQTLARNVLLDAATALSIGAPIEMSDALGAALAGAIEDAETDPAFSALMLRLPDVGELMQLRGQNDPEILQAARDQVRSILAQQLDAPLNAAFASYDPAQVFSTSALAAGRRAFASATLDLLTASGGERCALRGENFFFAARNMTDMMTALDSLSQIGGDKYEGALLAFRERFSDNALVMDKWFRIQAMASSGDGIETFRKLRAAPAFNLLNPNRVRALAGAFASGNYKSFHRRDGMGYQVVCDLIGDLDVVNGAVAARLCTLLETTIRVEKGRQALASQAIDGLLQRNNLSSNAREILGKIRSGL
jgi:aminopeptidase N